MMNVKRDWEMYSLLRTAEEEPIEIQRFYCDKAFGKQKE